MSPTSATAPPPTDRSDQRLHGRYPIALELQYKLLNKEQIKRFGFGRTVNMSSGGVLFESVIQCFLTPILDAAGFFH